MQLTELVEWLECFPQDFEVGVWYDQMCDDTYLTIHDVEGDVDLPNRILI